MTVRPGLPAVTTRVHAAARHLRHNRARFLVPVFDCRGRTSQCHHTQHTLLQREACKAGELLGRLKADVYSSLAAIQTPNTIAHTIGAAGCRRPGRTGLRQRLVGITSGLLTLEDILETQPGLEIIDEDGATTDMQQ